jgi:nucleotide-binding universal stress UspA family protein
VTATATEPLTGTELSELNAWWRAANYLSVGQIYLLDNPLLTEPLRPKHIKPRLLGHLMAPTPSGIPSHVAPETHGSIHEGGELGYSLAHAYGAVFDNPGLIAACVIGDGEAETGSPLSQAAVELAFEEAALRRVPLEAVCALADAPGVFGEARQMEQDFDHEMTPREEDHPDVMVTRRVVPGSPRSALLEAAFGAELVVTGARGRRGLGTLPLGSVAQAMLCYSPCPVAIVQPG